MLIIKMYLYIYTNKYISIVLCISILIQLICNSSLEFKFNLW